MAEECYAEYPEAGESFVVRMLRPGADGVKVVERDLEKVRGYSAQNTNRDQRLDSIGRLQARRIRFPSLLDSWLLVSI